MGLKSRKGPHQRLRPSGAGGSDMGTVINFRPAGGAARDSGSMARASEPAVVIILPVIRIERYDEAPNGSLQPEAGSTARRRRRRRTQRS